MTTQQDKAQELRTGYDAKVAQINASTTLALAGKQVALAKLYVPLKDQLTALKNEQNGNAKARLETLEKTVFGLPANSSTADTVSYRDALDRVTAIDPTTNSNTTAELTRLYETAKVSSDSILIKAIIFRAFDLEQSDLINEYLLDNPAQDAPVTELWDLIHAPQNNIAGNLIFELNPPPLLSSMGDLAIRNLAANGKITDTQDSAATASPFTTASF